MEVAFEDVAGAGALPTKVVMACQKRAACD